MKYTNATGSITYSIYQPTNGGHTFQVYGKNHKLLFPQFATKTFQTELDCVSYIENLFNTKLIPTGIKQGLYTVDGDPYGGVS